LRSQDILCQGRGSAANSVVCYCLGVTEVDRRMSVLFERFISKERNEPRTSTSTSSTSAARR
jgi:error-prone DNA polymerase